MNHFMKRTWSEINLNAVEHNFVTIKKLLNPKTKIMCVVKADAYGHGAEILAQTYQRLGADWFAVSNLDEAIQIRLAGVTKPILILGFTPSNMVKELSEFNITQAVFSSEYAKELNEMAEKINAKIDVHIKLDTGMSRIGFMFQSENDDTNTILEIKKICELKNLSASGIFTHFSVSDEVTSGKEYTIKQFENFNKAIALLEKEGIKFKLKHCCNSGGIINYPEMQMDMVRAGIILYGLQPSNDLKRHINIEPVMELKTVISQVKKIRRDVSVSYGRTFTSNSEMIIATVPIGYADGYLRSLSKKACMLIDGKRVPIIGRICMDQLMLDVSSIDSIRKDMVVTVFGRCKDLFLPVEELARIAGTINYEFVCLIGKRVPRIYLKDGQSIAKVNYILPN